MEGTYTVVVVVASTMMVTVEVGATVVIVTEGRPVVAITVTVQRSTARGTMPRLSTSRCTSLAHPGDLLRRERPNMAVGSALRATIVFAAAWAFVTLKFKRRSNAPRAVLHPVVCVTVVTVVV